MDDIVRDYRSHREREGKPHTIMAAIAIVLSLWISVSGMIEVGRQLWRGGKWAILAILAAYGLSGCATLTPRQRDIMIGIAGATVAAIAISAGHRGRRLPPTWTPIAHEGPR